MRIERILTDGTGQEFLVHVDIDEGGKEMDAAIARLANKARASKTGRVTALDGAVRVRVERVRR